MNTNTRQQSLIIKPVNPRYISVDENIHQTLTLYALSLYMAFRYEADYRNEESAIKRSAKFMYTKAKISKPQYYRCLNELERHGLVLRDADNLLGELCVIHVARELGFFTRGVRITDRGVSDRDRGVSDRDTDHYSIPSINLTINTNSESVDSSTPATKNKPKSEEMIREMIDVYRETFPDNPQPHPKLIATNLKKTLLTLIKKWPEADPGGKALDIPAFKRYMTALRNLAPKFTLSEYTTDDGNKRKNSMETFCRWNTFVSFLENKYS